MKNRTQNEIFPLTYTGWDEACGDYGDISLYDVEFTENFGPIKKGDKFDSVYIGNCTGTLACYIKDEKSNEDGATPIKEVHVVKFKVVPA